MLPQYQYSEKPYYLNQNTSQIMKDFTPDTQKAMIMINQYELRIVERNKKKPVLNDNNYSK